MTAEVSSLSNGLRVVTQSMPDVASASIGIWVGAGARAEDTDEHGMAHLLEHMAFKGTRTRSARAIAEEIEAVGGEINAATSMEHTAYFARVLEADTGLALDILSDILTDSALEAEELQREQGVIVQEIAAVADTPDDLVFDMLQEVSFSGQTIGRSILGTVESVRGHDRAAVSAFLDRHYRPERMVLAAAGAVDHQEIVARAEAVLGAIKPAPMPSEAPARFLPSERRETRDVEQVNIAFGLPGVSYRDPAIYDAQIFASILGGGMASRLFQEVREKRGLAYSVTAFHWGYADAGLFGLHAGAALEDVDKLVPVMLDEISSACDSLDEAEVSRAKAQLRAGLLMSLESSGARIDRLARQLLLYNRLVGVDEVIARINAVSVASVRGYARGMLNQGKLALAAVGPVEHLASAHDLARRWSTTPSN